MDQHHGDEPSTGFGRGWIPIERDIGLPSEAPQFLPGTERGTSQGLVEGAHLWAHPCIDEESPLHRRSGGPPPRAGEEPWPVRHDGWTAERRVRFLDHLAEHGNVRTACARVGLSAEAAYKLRRRDPPFARAWAAALLLARSHAEQVLADRALNGVAEPIFYRGEQVGARVRFDARLLLAHLERLDRLTADLDACEHAERFDELVALAAGLRPEGEGFAGAAGPGPCDGDPCAGGAGGDQALPLPREHFVAAAKTRGEIAAAAELYADDDEEEEEGDDFDEDDDLEEDEEELAEKAAAEEAERLVLAAGRAAAVEAGARWDAWFARACALVDGIGGVGEAGEAPYEVKSLGAATDREEPGWDPAFPGLRQPRQLRRGAPRFTSAPPHSMFGA